LTTERWVNTISSTCSIGNNFTLNCVLNKRIITFKMRYTLAQFKKDYPDDAACLRAVLKDRYDDTCPRCGTIGIKFHPITGRKGFVCSECDKHIYPLADTIFRKSETSLWNWFYAIYQISNHKNGFSAKTLERELGVTYKTAWRMCRQVRVLMKQEMDALGADGEDVEIDETYIGGRRKLSQKFDNKSVVFGVVERNGMARTTKVKSNGARVLLKEVSSTVAIKAKVFSDELSAYKTLTKRGYSHTTVNHSDLEYVRGTAHTNTIEGLWSQLKRSLDGTYHAVSPKYLQFYLDEFTFRYNYRAVAVAPVLLERAAMRVL
jgi:transposase